MPPARLTERKSHRSNPTRAPPTAGATTTRHQGKASARSHKAPPGPHRRFSRTSIIAWTAMPTRPASTSVTTIRIRKSRSSRVDEPNRRARVKSRERPQRRNQVVRSVRRIYSSQRNSLPRNPSFSAPAPYTLRKKPTGVSPARVRGRCRGPIDGGIASRSARIPSRGPRRTTLSSDEGPAFWAGLLPFKDRLIRSAGRPPAPPTPPTGTVPDTPPG